MADDAINIPIQVTGFEEASAELSQLAKRVSDIEKAAASASPKMKDAGKAMDQKAANAAKLSAVVGGLSPIIGRASVETAKLTSVFSTAGATVGGLTSVIGGPFGLALGAAVAATGLLVTAMGEAESAANAEKEALDRATLSLEDYIAAAEKRQQVDALRARLEGGTASAGEAAGAIDQRLADRTQLLNRQAEIQEHIQRLEASGNPALATRLRFAREQLQATQDNLSATDATIEKLRQNEIAARQVAQEGDEFKRQDSENARARQEASEAQRRASEAERRRIEENRRALEQMRTAADAAYEAMIKAGGAKSGGAMFDKESAFGKAANDNAFTGAAFDASDKFKAEQDAMAESAEASADRIQGAYGEAFGIAGSAATSAFAAIVAGQDVAVGALLSGVGQQLAAQGLTHVFEGAARSAASFGVDPSGPTLMGIGGAEIAAGAAFGAVGNAVTPPASSGSSSGPPKPSDQMQSGSGEGGSHTTIILNNLVPDAYAGERIDEALTRRRNRRGRVAA